MPHHWARQLSGYGHRVRLIAPHYVKPFLKRQKNDAADAEAIAETALRPTMRFVEPKAGVALAEGFVPIQSVQWTLSRRRTNKLPQER